MLKRSAYNRLLSWKDSPSRKALCIIGARQTGKTTLVREFGKAEYQCFCELNFLEDEDASLIFDESLNADTIIANLTAYTGQELVPGKTLILFDEIQACPNARTAIKFLVEDGRFDYIETGSQLGVQYTQVRSYPVGFEELFYLYPMDFQDFIHAAGVQFSTISLLKDHFQSGVPLSESIHQTMSKLFYSYIVVGGMPEAVNTYITTHDIGAVIAVQNRILELYRHDIAQYARGNDRLKIKSVFDAIPAQLSEKNRRFYLSHIRNSARSNRYDSAFLWLSNAGVALPCYNVTAPKAPLKMNERHNLFKLFMGDTGLLCAASLNRVQFDILRGNVDVNLGSVLENVMAQFLHTNGFPLYYYDSKKNGEVDFLLQDAEHIIPVEVKSGNDYRRHTSLNHMLENPAWGIESAYVLCKDNIKREDRITYLPWYLAMFLSPEKPPESFLYEVDLSALQDA